MAFQQLDRLEDPVLGHKILDDISSTEPPCSNEGHCNCGCTCCRHDKIKEDRDKDSIISLPTRGRSLTPKHDRTNGTSDPVEARPGPSGIELAFANAMTSVSGQEGLAVHPIERLVSDTAIEMHSHANSSIQNWLAQHHTPGQAYCFPSSPQPSMLVEPSTVAPSLASSGFLLSRTVTLEDLTTFAGSGFAEQTHHTSSAKECAFTPLWLTHELHYCRNLQYGDDTARASLYPGTIDIEPLG